MSPAEMTADTVRPGQICSYCRKEISEEEWQSLPFPPKGAIWDDGEIRLEMRNHGCVSGGATISRPATREIRGWEVA